MVTPPLGAAGRQAVAPPPSAMVSGAAKTGAADARSSAASSPPRSRCVASRAAAISPVRMASAPRAAITSSVRPSAGWRIISGAPSVAVPRCGATGGSPSRRKVAAAAGSARRGARFARASSAK